MSTTVRKDYLYYRSCRAKPGMAKLKAEYLEAFRLADACHQHMTVQCSGNNPPVEWLEKKQAFNDEREHFRNLLEGVTK